MTLTRTTVRLLGAALAVLTTLLAVPGAARAEPDRAICTAASCAWMYPKYEVMSTAKATNHVDWGQTLGSCTALSNGITCTVTKLRSSTNTVQTKFSVSKGWVTGELGYSYAGTTSMSVSCTSPKLKKNQTFSAYPKGTMYYYKIKKTFGGKVTTSDLLHSYNTARNQIACSVG
jgi:hypothetical protein